MSKTYEEIADIVREALAGADWQDLNAAANAMLALEPESGDGAYLDGWNDCQAAVVATLAVHLGIESSI
jgi:hypothetical protein